MIKVLAFDLVGVLVREKDVELTYEEEKLERLFGPNKSDNEYLELANNFVPNKDEIMGITDNIINKLYEVRDDELLFKIRKKYPNMKVVVATNHISRVRNYIIENFDVDEIFISAEMNKVKPNVEFYEELVKKLNIEPNEILFLDDNKDNVEGAKTVGLNTIKVERNMDLFEKIENYINER